jgi:hypothetical protein
MKTKNLVAKIISLCIVSFLAMFHAIGQSTSTNALAFPSINNAFLGKTFGNSDVSVDLYTGTAQVYVTICDLQSRELTLPISLSYVDGRGVKVQENASQVGLGWQLNAGGSISRVVRGFPDEQPNGYLGTQQWGQIVANAIRTDINTTPPLGTNAGTNAFYSGNDVKLSGQTWAAPGIVQSSSIPTADGEPDIFYVKTPFFNFQFSFDENGNPIFSNATGYKIIATNFVNTPSPTYSNSSFEVIDNDGNQFYFGSSSQSVESSTDSLYNVPYTFPSSWYLDKIITYNSKDIITFNYISGGNDVTYNYSWSEITNATQNPQSVTTLSTGKNIEVSPKYISSIVSTKGEADFVYNFVNRLDDPNMPYLTSIITRAYNPITQTNSSVLKQYNFKYSYFGSPSTNPNILRLKLDGITVGGNTVVTQSPLNLALFSYNTSVSLSDKTLPIFDYWGYNTVMVNPIPDLASYPYYNNGGVQQPDQTMAQAGILNSVTTQLGGTWNISYELNATPASSYSTNTTPIGGLRVTKIAQTLSTGENLYKSYQYLDPNGNSSGQIFSPQYNSNSYIENGSVAHFSSSPYVINDINGNFIGYSYVKELDQNGGYTIYNFSNFNDPGCEDLNTGSFSYQSNSYVFSYLSSVPILTPTTSLAYKRGLLKSAVVYNANGNMISQTTNLYSSLTNPVLISSFGYRPISLSAYINGNGGTYTSGGMYSTQIENYRLAQTVQKVYDQINPSNYIQTTTNYTYAANKRLVQVINSTDSKGLSHIQTFYHPDDANIPMSTAGLSILVGENRTNILVHQVDNRNGIIHEVHNTFAPVPIGAGRIILNTSSTYVNSTLVAQQLFSYDPYTTNLISVTKPGSNSNTILYGYNSNYPIASIKNALVGQYFFEGFEENTSSSVVINSKVAHTGNNYWNGNYQVTFTIPDQRSYIIQWWNLVGGVWNFNEQPYTASVTLTGPVDDIRIFPSDAQMTTYTYNPLVGKTSEIDPSGKKQVIEYDGLGRVNLIRDNDNNILKKYCYATAGEPLACAAIENLTYTFSIINNGGWDVTFVNTTTGQAYKYTVYTNSATMNGQTFGQIATGVYNLTVTGHDAATSHGLYFQGAYFGSSYTMNGGISTFYLNNVNVSNSANNLYISF